MSVITTSDLGGALEAALSGLDGDLHLPHHPTWDAARTAWNLAVDQRPVAVVQVQSPDDIIATVKAAAHLGLQVVGQGTGHSAGVFDNLDRTILIRTDRLRGVEIDPIAMRARVGAGTVWAEVTDAAAEFGLAALAGSSRDVGVVGYTLGGGVSWLVRSHGLAASSVTAVDLVTADGVLRRVEAPAPGRESTDDADLFWAVRGAGGSFGVVSALEFRLYPVPDVHAGALFWPLDRAAEVMHAWRDWTDQVPTTVTSSARTLRFPPLPDLPPFLQGRSFVEIEAVIQDTDEAARALLAPLRALGPEIDTFTRTPVSRLGELHMDPPGPVPSFGDGALLRSLDRATIDAFLAAVGPDSALAGPLLSAEIRHLGGEVAPDRGEGGAVASLPGEGLFYAVGITPTPEAAGAVVAALEAVFERLDPVRADADAVNFSETRRAPQRLFGTSLERLRRIKTTVDPRGTIRSQHSLFSGD